MKHLISATFKIKPASFIRLLVNYMFRLIMAAAKVVLIFVGLFFLASMQRETKSQSSPTTSSHNHNDWYVRRLNSHLKLVKQALNVKVTVFFISQIKTLAEEERESETDESG